MAWFKELIRTRPDKAEILWAGLFCSLCVSVGMSMVHAYMDTFPTVSSCAVVYCQAPTYPF